jgi:hypothetical protein
MFLSIKERITRPSSGQAASSTQHRHRRILACHSGAALACPKDLTIFMSQLDLEALLQRVPESNAAKSARRIFFNYLEE